MLFFICILLIIYINNAFSFIISKNLINKRYDRLSISHNAASGSSIPIQPEPGQDSNSNSNNLDSLIVKRVKLMKNRLDKEFAQVSLPAFVSLAADPLASLVDSMYVGRLPAYDQAGMGIAISAQYSVSKLYNDPLMKTSTSLVAGKEGEELSASVATAIFTALVLGIAQSAIFFFATSPILSLMGVSTGADMRLPALKYLKWRALGVPATTVLLVSNGIFRGRGDTTTPLYCTTAGNLCNILLDPILIFGLGMGVTGAGAATSISQWVTALPLLYMLNKNIPFSLTGSLGYYLRNAFKDYFISGSLILIRTIAKISAYSVTAAAAAGLGSVPMAAYSLTFNLGFATSQLCESVSIASQSLLARDVPFDSADKKESARHVIKRSLLLGTTISALLAIVLWWQKETCVAKLTQSPDVRAAALEIMPIVLLTQILKGLAYSTGGILLGGLDWVWSSAGTITASIVTISLIKILPNNLYNIWIALCAFMGTQVMVSALRVLTNTGPWTGLKIWDRIPFNGKWTKYTDGEAISN